MKTIIIPFTFALLSLLSSCSLFDHNDGKSNPETFTSGSGVYIVNEGNFNSGNGSLSFYSFDSMKIRNDIFSSINSRPLGDVPYSMDISGGQGYIVVNNSGKIEVIDINTLKSTGSITGLNSPRNILFINPSKAYVTSLWSNDVSILNLMTNTISGTIKIRRSSEAVVKYGDRAFVSCWVSGNEIMVINTATDQITDSIVVGHEPESMVIDKNNKLWVLCSGGYSGDYFPELICINTSTDAIEKRLTFSSKSEYPSTLRINGTGDTLYYINQDLWMMPVVSEALPGQSFVRSSGRTFYKLGISDLKHEIFATNVVDYQQNGYLLRIANDGTIIDSVRTDIIPGGLCFKTKLN
jgi:DNA-binding beta-propeller fold protein YncE